MSKKCFQALANHIYAPWAENARLVLTMVLALALLGRAQAAVIKAYDCSLASVRTACSVALSGDIVQVPAGTTVWTNTLLIRKDIQLIGAGAGQTIITDEIPRSINANLIQIVNASPRISGFTFQGGTVNTTIPNGGGGAGSVNFYGNCPRLRVDNCLFNNLYNIPILVIGPCFGVIDDCQIVESNWLNAVQCFNGVAPDAQMFGDESWATPVYWGSVTNWLYVETCGFYFAGACGGGSINDMSHGAQLVVRYCNITNAYFLEHGTENRNRGGRAFEIYSNNFVNQFDVGVIKVNNPISLRSGSGVIFGNTITGAGYGQFWQLNDYRDSEDYNPWVGAYGQNPWDSNNPALFYTGTFTGSNGASSYQDTSANWAVNQWVGYTIQNINRQAQLGVGADFTFSMVYSNDSQTLYLLPDSGNPPYYMAWTNGDSAKLYQMVYEMDGLGMGSGDLITGITPVNSTTGTASWPHQTPEYVYQWNNTFNGIANYIYGSLANGNPNFVNVLAQEGVMKPDYTPLVYPHPLVSNSGQTLISGSGNSGSGGGTNSIIPPSDLQTRAPNSL